MANDDRAHRPAADVNPAVRPGGGVLPLDGCVETCPSPFSRSLHLLLSSVKAQSAIAVYTAVTARRASYDGFTWQAPALIFTASAFLYTIIFAPSTRRGPRVLAASINIVVSVLGYALFLRAIDAQDQENSYIADIERDFDIEAFTRRGSHGVPWSERRPKTMRVFGPWRVPAYSIIDIWSVGLCALVVVSIAILLLSAITTSFFGA